MSQNTDEGIIQLIFWLPCAIYERMTEIALAHVITVALLSKTQFTQEDVVIEQARRKYVFISQDQVCRSLHRAQKLGWAQRSGYYTATPKWKRIKE